MAKRYNVTVGKKYIKDGEEKKTWKNVGTLVRFEATPEKAESFLLELNMFPETKFSIFEDKPKDDKQTPVSVSVPKDEINPDDIPF